MVLLLIGRPCPAVAAGRSSELPQPRCGGKYWQSGEGPGWHRRAFLNGAALPRYAHSEHAALVSVHSGRILSTFPH